MALSPGRQHAGIIYIFIYLMAFQSTSLARVYLSKKSCSYRTHFRLICGNQQPQISGEGDNLFNVQNSSSLEK